MWRRFVDEHGVMRDAVDYRYDRMNRVEFFQRKQLSIACTCSATNASHLPPI
jgi:hypothetical protein